MSSNKKTFTLILNKNYGTAELDEPIRAREVTLKQVAILAMDVAGAAATPVIGVDIRQFSSSMNNNFDSQSRLLLYTDVAKVHTIYSTDITFGLNGNIPKVFEYRTCDDTYGNGTTINYSTEIIHIALTFEYEQESLI